MFKLLLAKSIPFHGLQITLDPSDITLVRPGPDIGPLIANATVARLNLSDLGQLGLKDVSAAMAVATIGSESCFGGFSHREFWSLTVLDVGGCLYIDNELRP